VKPIIVFACESQPIIVEGLRGAIQACQDLQLAGAAQPDEALPAIADLRPDIVLISQQPDLISTFALMAEIQRASAGSRPVLWVSDLTMIDPGRALELGAYGVIRKTLPTAALLECLRAVGTGDTWVENPQQRPGPVRRQPGPRLTPREREIARLICRGMTNKEIAQALAIAPGTVKVHLMHIFEKTGARNRFDLAIAGRRWTGGNSWEEPRDPARTRGPE